MHQRLIQTNLPRLFVSLWGLLTKQERRESLILLGLMGIGMGFEAVGVGIVIPVLKALTHPDLINLYPAVRSLASLFGEPSAMSIIVLGMSLVIGLYVFKGAFLTYLTWRQARFTYNAQAELSERVFDYYLWQPYTFHLQRNSAELIRNLTGEVNVVTFGAILPALQLLAEAMVFIAIAALLFVVAPIAATLIVSILGVSGWSFNRLTRSRIERWGHLRHHHEGSRVQHIQQGLGGVKEIKILGRERNFLLQYARHTRASARVGQLHSTLQQIPRLWMEVMAVSCLCILVVGALAQGLDIQEVIVTLGVFLVGAFRLMPSANRMINAWQSIRYSLPVIDLFRNELEDLKATVRCERGLPVLRFEQLQLREITYAYGDHLSPALSNISITVTNGETVGIVGVSGSGKSTLGDIILGVLCPTSGHVMLDGKDIRDNLHGWQSQIGYVSQSIFLTDDTIRRNVAFGLPDEEIDDQAVRNALRLAQLDDFVQSLPDRMETAVGERGVRISGGQRQRIGLARALYHDPAVLVLDEATSALDLDTEAGVIDAVRSLHKKKTIIIIAHRLATLEACDRLYALDEGRLVQQGLPIEMLASYRQSDF